MSTIEETRAQYAHLDQALKDALLHVSSDMMLTESLSTVVGHLHHAAIAGFTEIWGQGLKEIAHERGRQIYELEFSAERDDTYFNGELARVAALYALPPERRDGGFWAGGIHGTFHLVKLLWPDRWNFSWWKPTPEDRIRELAKAGALIAAEIDRLQRAAVRPHESTGRVRSVNEPTRDGEA